MAVVIGKELCYGIFHRVIFDVPPTLGEAVRVCGFGSNRHIKQQGFRVQGYEWNIPPLKKWPLIRDSRYIIDEESYLARPKGGGMIIISYIDGLDQVNDLGFVSNQVPICSTKWNLNLPEGEDYKMKQRERLHDFIYDALVSCGFDGLYMPGCGCTCHVSDLFISCDCRMHPEFCDCEPGYLGPRDTDEDDGLPFKDGRVNIQGVRYRQPGFIEICGLFFRRLLGGPNGFDEM